MSQDQEQPQEEKQEERPWFETADPTYEDLNEAQLAHLENVIQKNKESLWTAEWELQFILDYYKDEINPAKLLAARAALGKAREKNVEGDQIDALEEKVRQGKHAVKTAGQVKQLVEDLMAKVSWMEGLRDYNKGSQEPATE